MNTEEKNEKLEFLQHFFFKSFLVSFAFLLIATLMCIVMRDFQYAFVQKYFGMGVPQYNFLVVQILGIWKILVFQFTLVPALVILCMRKCGKCCCKK